VCDAIFNKGVETKGNTHSCKEYDETVGDYDGLGIVLPGESIGCDVDRNIDGIYRAVSVVSNLIELVMSEEITLLELICGQHADCDVGREVLNCPCECTVSAHIRWPVENARLKGSLFWDGLISLDGFSILTNGYVVAGIPVIDPIVICEFITGR
jgi:hypothetical protein